MAASNSEESSILYSRNDCRRVKNLFSVQLGFLMFMGQIPLKVDKWMPSSISYILSSLYSIFIIGQTSHLAVLFAKTSFDALGRGELNQITDAVTMVIIYSFSFFATCYWLFRSKKLLDFVADINLEYRHHSIAGLTFNSAYSSYVRARKVTIYWQIACIAGVTLWGLAPIILRSHTLPLACWYPFDPLQPGIYEIIYILQLFGQINVGTTFGNGSALYVSLVFIMLGQFDVLFCSLKNYDFHARLLAGEKLNVLNQIQDELLWGSNDELNQYMFSVEYKTDKLVLEHLSAYYKGRGKKSLKEAMRESLKECVYLHHFILRSCNTLEELFNPYCLVKSFQITLQLCLLVFVGVVGEQSTLRIINLVQYLALTLLELLMFTYFGELLRNHSMRSGEAYWRSSWWQNANIIRKDVLIFLVNSKRVVRLTAGKFYAMDVQRLMSVITQAVSFLTLLQKLSKKNNKQNLPSGT